ncbi:LOW QUALITY PROTEIN: uncharacterized protein B0I36DRAFT_378718 [Microdochium trichocladiopsis]|uniref:Fungal-type protein kinase domain-containing protein n=1 Tax=Microdochium trichocladiopsis TaxID=1682393 RepID=A0A9P8XQF5_9PEZI|nr:LOW QUALITY PROTEIN: uncharacterized protein B0I36DRAFT_378718 [Microdochium trichocladiopsis]KAH7007843.1 LOW QUALITY PROTEIN: hypothetical protein B0I36DRAFT_378718 [Microdochium trichocladiopsis]
MDDLPRSKIINNNPIGKGLDAFYGSFNSVCEDRKIPCTPDALGQLDQDAVQNLPAADLLPARTGRGSLRDDLLRLELSLRSDDFDFDRIKPLLNFANSSEYRKDIDRFLRDELGAMYVGLPRFHETFFGRVAGLEAASEAVFKKCMEGSEPLFSNRWSGWPTDANQDDVLSWFAELNEKLATFAGEYKSTPTHRRRPLAQPNKPIQGSTAERKLDVGFVNDPKAGKDSRCHWSHILEFDRLGAIASEQFNINEDGLQFISEEELSFDPTIITASNKRFIKIERDGSTKRLIINELMQRARYIASRATTCWKAHLKGHAQTPLQYPERDKEGELLREATGQGVVNVARYYHHETVQVHGTDDDIRSNVRGGLDVTTATNYRPERSMPPPSIIASRASRRGRSSSRATSKKRSSSQIGAPLPPSKRSCSASPTKAGGDALPNRVHRRVILRNYGKPIYKASSRSALLIAMEGCIEGHESLRKASFLHRDISINNLIPSFLIDLDLTVREQREGASRAKGKTGTRAFMAIGALLGEQHYIGPTKFNSWNYESDNKLVRSKVGDKSIFLKIAEENFTSYYQPLIPLRRKVFPNGERWKRLEPELYSSMKKILRDAQKDPD